MRLQADVLIIGAGPAGLASAIQLKQQGIARVTVVDREPEPGGMPRLCHHTGFGVWDFHRLYSGPQYARRYTALARQWGVEILTETTITGWESDHALTYTSPEGLGVIEAPAILLATGVRERPRSARLVPGYRPRGIFTTGSLQRFVDEEHLPVGNQAVIVGAEGVSLSAFMTLTKAGVRTVAFLTELPAHQMYFPYAPVKWWLVDFMHRTPIYTATQIRRVLGRFRVEGVEVVHLPTEKVSVIPCDTLVFTGDWIPEHEIARKGELRMDPGTRGPQVDSRLRTSRPGVFAAGNVLRGAETAATSAQEGRKAAQTIKAFLQGHPWPQTTLPILTQSPILWVFPNQISQEDIVAPPKQITFRVSQFLSDVQVQIQQGGKTLYRHRYRQLLPNETMNLSGRWMTAVDLHGAPPVLMISD